MRRERQEEELGSKEGVDESLVKSTIERRKGRREELDQPNANAISVSFSLWTK